MCLNVPDEELNKLNVLHYIITISDNIIKTFNKWKKNIINRINKKINIYKKYKKQCLNAFKFH